jgi:hypothetical protein
LIEIFPKNFFESLMNCRDLDPDQDPKLSIRIFGDKLITGPPDLDPQQGFFEGP